MAPPSLVTGKQRAAVTVRVVRLLGWSVVWVLLVAGIFTLPSLPAHDLESSWRMALGYFFEHRLQLGREIVFTYGLLGFAAGNIFSGLQFWSLIGSQLVLALVSAVTIIRQGRRLPGASRLLFFAFFLLFGITNGDVLQILVIALLGFELLRLAEQSRYRPVGLIGLVLAGYAQIKFTNLLFATFIVLVALVYSLVLGRGRAAAWLVGSFAGAFLGIWIACGQSLLNLPAYFYYSWQLSEGYQWAMGLATPAEPLWKALVLLAVMAGYAGLHLGINPRKPRAVANVLLLGAFTFLQWKHGFVRSDPHMLGFFFCALLTLTAYPALLDDPGILRRTHRGVFLCAIGLGVWGVDNAQCDFVWQSVPEFRNKIAGNFDAVFHWWKTRQNYLDHVAQERRDCDLPLTRRIVGRASLDVLGHEQGVALFNGFNYRPRPVFQGYCTFMPALANLNAEHFAADQAPQFVLLQVQAIDRRLPAMDDALVLLQVARRYEYVHNENGFTLWHLRPGSSDPARIGPTPLRTAALEPNRPLWLEDLNRQPLWLKIILPPSPLGKIRRFLYKLPPVMLSIQDVSGFTRDFLLPLPQGRSGFVINPIIKNQADFAGFANNRPVKRIRSITIKIAPADARFFAASAQVELAALPPPPGF